MENKAMTMTEAIIKNGRVVDGSRYPVVIYEIHTSEYQDAVAVKLVPRTEYAVVDHAWLGGPQVLVMPETLAEAREYVKGKGL
jgi:hypothetical protein